MTDIDWSKAPKGATHYGPRQQGFKECWYKHDQKHGWLYMLADTRCEWLTLHDVTGVPLIPVPVRWTGDGLPPVGTVCEFLTVLNHWQEVRITGHGELGVCFRATGNEAEHYASQDCAFRPIRTPEQIAEEERNAAIVEIGRLFHEGGPAAIYFAGYRKQEAV